MINGVCDGNRRGTTSIRRTVAKTLLVSICGCCFALGLLPALQPADLHAQSDQKPDFFSQPLADVVVEGNITIPAAAIKQHIEILPGRKITPDDIREDVRSLFSTRWFVDVETRFRQSPVGPVLVYKVVERPVLRSVEFHGNQKVKTKQLQAITGLKPGSPYDISANRESVRRIKAHYKEKGYYFVEVKLLKGDSADERDVVFEVDEGPKVIVSKVRFEGNDFFSGQLLKTKLQTNTAILGLSFLGGKYDPITIPNDIAALKDYYNSLGFFDVTIEPSTTFSEDRSRVVITYTIAEGERYRVRNITTAGNRLFTNDELMGDFELASGEFFNGKTLSKSLNEIRDEYGQRGYLFAQVNAEPHFLDTPGEVDLLLQIKEDRPYRIRRMNEHIQGDYPHTKDTTILNILNRAGLQPGAYADPAKIRLAKRRLEGQQIFDTAPQSAPQIKISKVDPHTNVAENRTARGQSGSTTYRQPAQPAQPARQEAQPAATAAESFSFRGQSYDPALPQPSNPIWMNSPQGDPYGNAIGAPQEGWIDLDTYVTEGRTGRLMFGVGINSDAGVVGSIVLSEQNFDIMRPPTSWRDVLNGHAWRGGGQQFRLEAVPGNEVSRYLVSWSDPYFLDTDFSLGVSGFFFNRFYDEWHEQRTGGRISVGHQFTPEISLSGVFRFEDVQVKDPAVPTPPILQESVDRDNFLTTFRLSLAHDTRDAPFLPASGHMVQASAEQAFGDFEYPRLELEGSQYFTLHSRPDGGGRHVLSLFGQAAWTDAGTPVFERYFAGGSQTIRGFQFRGISPREQNVAVGGNWMLMGSVEYMMPVTADEMVQAVAFTDFGTVEEDISVKNFRVAVGAGLRLTIPAMGPVPIALDFAFPLANDPADDEQVFSFTLGINR